VYIGKLTSDSMLIGRFSILTRLASLALLLGRGPETGSRMCPSNPNSFGPHILMVCVDLLQLADPLGPKEVVAVFDLRKR
jgi:hypothetical protein